jgi:lysophospholipase L1-like esterase
LFLTPPSLYTPYDGGKINEHTVAIRKAILAIAEKYHSPVLDISALAGFDGASSDTRFFPDGVHPNSEGHRRMALLLYEYLAELQKTLHAQN